MERPLLTQRLGSSTQKNPEFIDTLVDIIRSTPGSCDEVWFASDYGFPALETHRESAAALLPQAEKLRKAGVRVSLQISNTIGHGRYMSARDCSGLVYEGSPVERMTGADGTVADYCFCFNGEYFRSYTIEAIKPYLALQPYAVWVDDDFRATNHDPVREGCFCDACIDRFNAFAGTSFTREQLVRELNYGSIDIRRKYVELVRASLSELMLLIAKTVKELSPGSLMGFQHYCNGGYTGRGLGHIFDAMREGSGQIPLSRPGGGAYSDSNPNEFINKSWTIAWQNYLLPDYIEEIRPEIENLPDTVFGKTIAGTCFETSLYLANGANSMSYALLMNDYEPMAWHGEMLAAFAVCRPYWEALSELSGKSSPGGIYCVVSDYEWLYQCPPGQEQTGFYWKNEGFGVYNKLLRTAIPLALRKSSSIGSGCAPVYLLHAECAKKLTDAELEFLTGVPVVTDGEALRLIAERGFEFSACARSLDTSMLYERFTDHPVNRGFEGKSWSQSFYIKSGSGIFGVCEPFGVYDTNSRACPKVSDGAYPYSIASAAVTTSKGVKWAVFGHSPWNEIISTDRRNQLLRAADYISNNRCPAILETPWQAVLLPREDANGLTAGVTVVNCTIGASPALTLRIRRPKGESFSYMCAGMKSPAALPYTRDGADYILELESVDAWATGSVFIDR